MKTFIFIILFGLKFLSQSYANESIIQMIQMDMRFRDVPEKWLSFIEESDRKKWTTKEGISPFPSSVWRMNTPTKASIETEYPLPDADKSDPTIVSGIFVELTPKKIDQQLFLVGQVVMKRVVEGDPKGEAVRLESQEIFIRSKIENNKPLLVLLADGGKLQITPTLLDPTGRPLEEKKVEQSVDGKPH
jgi:hypothetical protein